MYNDGYPDKPNPNEPNPKPNIQAATKITVRQELRKENRRVTRPTQQQVEDFAVRLEERGPGYAESERIEAKPITTTTEIVAVTTEASRFPETKLTRQEQIVGQSVDPHLTEMLDRGLGAAMDK